MARILDNRVAFATKWFLFSSEENPTIVLPKKISPSTSSIQHSLEFEFLKTRASPFAIFFANILQCSQNNATMKQINLSTRHNPTEFFFRLKKSKLKLEAQTTRCQFLSKNLPPTVNFHTHSRIFRRSASSAITLPKYSTIFIRFQSLLYSLISAGDGLATEPPASLH